MYNLSFIEQMEGSKNFLKIQKDYMIIKNKILELQKEGYAIADKGEKLTDENSKEYKELVEKANKIKEGINNLGKDLNVVKRRFEIVKQYMLQNLKENKEILEKYKGLENDKELMKLKEGLSDLDINKEKLDIKIYELSQKVNLNKLSKQEINQLSKEDREKAIEAREQYLNNKKELEKNEKIKYIMLLGDKEAKRRIFECESAMAYIEQQFNIENIEKGQEKLEEILDIQKQMPQIKFDLKTHTYKYINERGKETEYEMFKKEKDKKCKSMISENTIENIKKWAEEKGLSKKQIDAIDYNVVEILKSENPNLLDNYLDAIKKENDPKFSIEYNFMTKGMDKQNKMDRKTLRKIKKSAKRQKSNGIAKVFKNKVRGKFAAILFGLGLSGIASFIEGNQMNPALDQAAVNTITGEILEDIGKLNEVKTNMRESKSAQAQKKEQKENNSKENNSKENNSKENNKKNTKEDNKKNNIDDKNNNKEPVVGDYVNILEGAMLFDNPTDEIRIMNGLSATETIKIKQSSKDKLYKVNKVGYYSLNGDFVEIEQGQDLEKVLKDKGLDKSFIKEGNSIKMYHTVADGISQWVKAQDIEKVQVRTDKFGNPIDKTEQEKMVDEALKNYDKQKSDTRQQNTKNEQSVKQSSTKSKDSNENTQYNKTNDLDSKEKKDHLKEEKKAKLNEKRDVKDDEPDIIIDEEGPNRRVNDSDEELKIILEERFDDIEIISEKEFNKQYKTSARKAYNNRNTIIDVDFEMENDDEILDVDDEYQNSIEEANERYEMMMEALQEQREVEEELRMQQMGEER